jgi:hypothetical protein
VIIDPFSNERAIDNEGRLMGSIRFLPIKEGHTPTVAELSAAPIVGYALPPCFSCGTNTCEHVKGTK